MGTMTKKFCELTLVVFHDADFQLVTSSVEDEIAAGGHVPEVAHREDAVADDQMTLQNRVGLAIKTFPMSFVRRSSCVVKLT